MIDHDLTDDQVIGQMNELSRKLYRKFPLPEKIYKFTMTDIPYYKLPYDCSEDRIRCVVINETEYIKLTPEIQNPPDCFCTVFVGSLYIHPNQPNYDAYIYYRQRIDNMRSDNKGATPTFPEDFHDLYVYDAARWIAGIRRDVDLANNFQAQFDEIYKNIESELKKMGLKRVKITTNWW
jgi:hypothetical protein